MASLILPADLIRGHKSFSLRCTENFMNTYMRALEFEALACCPTQRECADSTCANGRFRGILINTQCILVNFSATLQIWKGR